MSERNDKDVKIPIYYIEDYISKVIIQSFENITGKEYSGDNLDINIFAADDNIFINWKVNEYEPEVYKIAIKVRYRLRNNYEKHFPGTPIVFTKHTIDCNDDIRNKIENCNEILVTENIDIENLKECIGDNIFDKVSSKIKVELNK